MSQINWSQMKLEDIRRKRLMDQHNAEQEAIRAQAVIQDYYEKKRSNQNIMSFAGNIAATAIGIPAVKALATPMTKMAQRVSTKAIGAAGGGLGSLLGSLLTPKSKNVKAAMRKARQNYLMPYFSKDIIQEEEKTLSNVFLKGMKGFTRTGDLMDWLESLKED